MTPGWLFPHGPGGRRDVPWIDPAVLRSGPDSGGPDGDADGLVGVGGTLTPALLLRAYTEGVFPWFNEDDPVLWWSPDPRAVIELDGLHVSRRLARTIRSGKFRTTADAAFEAVMRGCAENREDGTWVTEEMIRGYTELYDAGHAHSIEVWSPTEGATGLPPFNGWELAGGIYGVAVGGLFAGESMFHRKTDASKVALVSLVERLKDRGFVLFDVQMTTEHTTRMGAANIPRDDYLRRLREAVCFTDVRF